MLDLEVVFTFNISTNRGGVHSKSTHWLINSRKPTTAERHQLTNSQAQKLINSQAHQLTISSTQKLTNSKTHQLTSLQTHQLKSSPTRQLTSSSTQKLKSLSFILQQCSGFRSVLAKIQLKKQAKCHYFQLFTLWGLSIFKPRTCILHHLAFLFWLPARIFSTPKTYFQPLKTHFSTTISPFSALFFMVHKGFVYAIVVYFYAFCITFSGISHCVQHQNAQHLASKRTAFSGILHCVQHQNAQHFAANGPKTGVSDGRFK